MNRILEFSPSQEEAVVSRVLMLVHQAMDQHLPSAGQADRQFTKTLYTEYVDDAEKTSTAALPRGGDDADFTSRDSVSAFGSNEVTSPGSAAAVAAAEFDQSEAAAQGAPTGDRGADRSHSRPASMLSRNTTHPTGHTEGDKTLDDHEGPDWVTRVTLALLIVGLILLTYVLLV